MKQSSLFGSIALLSSINAIAQQPTDIELGMVFDQGLSVVAELDNKYRFTVGNDGGAFDYLLAHGEFDANSPMTWYAGVGGWSEWDHKEFGVRVPLGLNWDLTRGWNLYGQVHPELNFYSGLKLQVGAAIGVKYRF